MTDLRYSPERRIVAYIPHPELPQTCVVNASTGKLPAFAHVAGMTREQLLAERVRDITGTFPSVDHATGSEFGTLYAVTAPRNAIVRRGYLWLNHCLKDIVAEQQAFMEDPNITSLNEHIARALEVNLDKMAVGALASSLGSARETKVVFSYMFHEQADLLKSNPPEGSFYA